MKYFFNEDIRKAYEDRGIGKVDGWLTTGDQILISSICRGQTQAGISGSIGEIGVHHGKLFILLLLYLHEGEQSFCVDIFEDQHLNLDQSGSGVESIFLANVEAYAAAKPVNIIKDTSLNIAPCHMVEKFGKARIISVDGGHSREVVLNDLAKCDDLLSKDGVIIIDDYFNPAWPGVSEGVNIYFRQSPDVFSPFAIGLNKVFLCRPDFQSFYRDCLTRSCKEMYAKATQMLGCEVDVFTGYQSISDILGHSRFSRAARMAKYLEGKTDLLRDWLAHRSRC